MLFNADAGGLRKALREREERLLRILWTGEASTSGLAEATGLRRDEVLRILGELHERGVVDVREDYTLGPGREVWSARVDEAGLRRMVARAVLLSLLRDWEDELLDAFAEAIKARPEALSKLEAALK